jgi:predicted glycoside hydrolase/deacetylase ChbG (UPF0249 family)
LNDRIIQESKGLDSIIINADDLGATPGMNAAIFECHQKSCLTHASIMVNTPYFDDAVKIVEQCPQLKVGLHINLSYGKPVSDPQNVPLLLNKKGCFIGFSTLLYLIFSKKKDIEKQIKFEMEAQILKAKQAGIEPTHLDSHRHTHVIPFIFNIASELASTYSIPRIRNIHEDLFVTSRMTGSVSYLFDGGIIKFILLDHFNKQNFSSNESYFFSILNTSKIDIHFFRNIDLLDRYKRLEIMLHPGYPRMDKSAIFYDKMHQEYYLSRYRTQERLVCLKLKEFF